MLCAPNRQLAVHYNLSFQDQFNSLHDSFFRTSAAILIYKGVGGFLLGNVAQEIHNADHRVVIESDVIVVALSRWIVLRPTAICLLGLKKIIDAFEKSCFVTFQFRARIDSSEVSQLGVGGAVVNGRIDLW